MPTSSLIAEFLRPIVITSSDPNHTREKYDYDLPQAQSWPQLCPARSRFH